MNAIVVPKFSESETDYAVETISRALASTMGPFGRVVEFEAKYSTSHTFRVRKGLFVARCAAQRNIGGTTLQRILQELDSIAGMAMDGSSTCIVMVLTMLQEARLALSRGCTLEEIERGISKGTQQALEKLRSSAIPWDGDRETLQRVCATAANDEALGRLAVEAVELRASGSPLVVVKGDEEEAQIIRTNGLEFGALLRHARWAESTSSVEAFYDLRVPFEIDDVIVIAYEKDPGTETIIQNVGALAEGRRPILVVIAEPENTFDRSQFGAFARSRQGEIIVIDARSAMPGIFEDLTALTGQVNAASDAAAFAPLGRAGSAKKVVLSIAACTIVGGEGDAQRIESRAKEIEGSLDKDHPRERSRRATGLRGGMSVIKLGPGATESQVNRRERLEDAILAAHRLGVGGMVAGGGVALARARLAVSCGEDDHDCAPGFKIVGRALAAPLTAIIANGESLPDVVLSQVDEGDDHVGYDARIDRVGDFRILGVVDPAHLVADSLRLATDSVCELLRGDNTDVSSSAERSEEALASIGPTIDTDVIPARHVRPSSDSYRVWFGTDCRRAHATDPLSGFENVADDRVHYGTCVIQVPQCQAGQMGRSWLFRIFNSAPGPANEILSIETEDEQRFCSDIGDYMARLPDGRKEVLLVIHGYNVSFEAAALHAAQIGMDLKLDSPTVFFAWPSTDSLVGYMADEATVERSAPRFCSFLSVLLRIPGVSAVNVVAHSMGNRLLLAATRHLANDPSIPRFGQLILAAADVDGATFEDAIPHYDLAKQDRARTTLYWNSKDKALKTSAALHRGRRVGLRGSIRFREGSDSIRWCGDWSLLDLGHSYHASAAPVLEDMRAVLANKAHPKLRNLTPHPKDRPIHWDLKPRA